jgi:LL-diaminopimelate aminotransferase
MMDKEFQIADRLSGVNEYYFSAKLKEIAQMQREGKKIINLGIGSPDLPPHRSVITELTDSAALPDHHGYQSYIGIPELRKAFADWYLTYYGVMLNPDSEILPLIGSKEGIMHIAMTFLDEKDEVLVPDPGYPAYAAVSAISGAKIRVYDLNETNNWLPDLNLLENQNLKSVKLMWVNYPNMPTGAAPDISFYQQLVDFGKKHSILIVNDNPYSFILNPNPRSILSIPGALENCIELNSLSKSHNMAGWRIGMAAGAPSYLQQIIKFKSNMDSGMYKPIQKAAVKALALSKDWFDDLNRVYAERREKAEDIMHLLGCVFQEEQTGLFLWGKIPTAYQDGYTLCDHLLYNAGVFITPGGIFGKNGDSYIRISLCSSKDILEDAYAKIKGIL